MEECPNDCGAEVESANGYIEFPSGHGAEVRAYRCANCDYIEASH